MNLWKCITSKFKVKNRNKKSKTLRLFCILTCQNILFQSFTIFLYLIFILIFFISFWNDLNFIIFLINSNIAFSLSSFIFIFYNQFEILSFLIINIYFNFSDIKFTLILSRQFRQIIRKWNTRMDNLTISVNSAKFVTKSVLLLIINWECDEAISLLPSAHLLSARGTSCNFDCCWSWRGKVWRSPGRSGESVAFSSCDRHRPAGVSPSRWTDCRRPRRSRRSRRWSHANSEPPTRPPLRRPVRRCRRS